jgi:hypothetical protein
LENTGSAKAIIGFVAEDATVSFTTSWIPEGPNLFAYVARDRGFWKKAGLDVSVLRGSGSGVGNDDAFPLRNLLGVQHLCRTYRFGGDFPSRFTVSFLGGMLVEKCAADRYR